MHICITYHFSYLKSNSTGRKNNGISVDTSYPSSPQWMAFFRVEAEATLKRIASHLTQKWQEPYTRTIGYVKSRVGITLVRTTHHCIQGGRVPESCIILT